MSATEHVSTLARALHCLAWGEEHWRSGQRELALGFYGQAIDDLLDEGLYAMAATACTRLLQCFPDVTRARGTLSVLSLAECLRTRTPAVLRMARRDLDDYLAACRQQHQRRMAVRFLRQLAEVTEATELREWMAEALAELGDHDGAARTFVAAREERQGLRPHRRLPGDQRARWAAVLRTPLPYAA